MAPSPQQSITSSSTPRMPAIDAFSSNALLLLQNLRCLHLDLLQDWPKVTRQTFSARPVDVTSVAQKHRIRAAEWVLYRLFELWDPVECRTKLSAFFPALEPLQSIKLRAAQYQLLSHLKTTSILSRECNLRKSMLDECKGERFEEVLFVFSTLVLQKKIHEKATRWGAGLSVAEQLGTARLWNEEDNHTAESLTLAYKKSIAVSLCERKEVQTRLRRLNMQLCNVNEVLEQREAQANVSIAEKTKRPQGSAVNHEVVKKDLNTHIPPTDPPLLDLIITGDPTSTAEPFLEAKFIEHWRAALDHNERFAPPIRPPSVLQEIQSRAIAQQDRLSRWRAFQADMSKRNEDTIVRQSPIKRSDMKSPSKTPQKMRMPVRPGYTPSKTPRGTTERFGHGTKPTGLVSDSLISPPTRRAGLMSP